MTSESENRSLARNFEVRNFLWKIKGELVICRVSFTSKKNELYRKLLIRTLVNTETSVFQILLNTATKITGNYDNGLYVKITQTNKIYVIHELNRVAHCLTSCLELTAFWVNLLFGLVLDYLISAGFFLMFTTMIV